MSDIMKKDLVEVIEKEHSGLCRICQKKQSLNEDGEIVWVVLKETIRYYRPTLSDEFDRVISYEENNQTEIIRLIRILEEEKLGD
jgi:hypothetical protein